jgi:phage tail-like protein
MPDRHGPMRTGRFEVQIDSVEVAGFRRIDLPRRYSEVDTGPEGRKRIGQTSFDDLTMERGVKPGATELVDWRVAIEEGKVDQGRKEIAVVLQDEEGTPQFQWTFSDAWVKEYDPPELDASADGDIATESVTVAYDKMERKEV